MVRARWVRGGLPCSGFGCRMGGGSARKIRAIRSWLCRSSCWASSGWRRCFTARWAVLACSLAPGAGWAGSAGGRRGGCGGAAAAGRFCSSGAALLFAWRDYMPTFTDASLIAAGTGALLWALLAAEATVRRRTWAGLAGFVALEAATFTRYTDIVVLGCAAVAVVVAWRLRKVPTAALAWWLGSVAAFGAGLAVFDDLVLCLHLDRQRLRHHLAVRPVLRPGDRRHRAARRLAAGPRAAPVLAGRGDIGGCRGRDVRAGPVVVRRHACQPGPPEGHGPDPAGSRRGKSAEWFQASAPAHGHPRDVRRSALAECRHSP